MEILYVRVCIDGEGETPVAGYAGYRRGIDSRSACDGHARVRRAHVINDQVIGSIEYLSAKNSLTILDSIINSYMRGQGYKMGNWKGIEKHYGKASGLLFLVVEDSLDKYEELRWIRAAIPAQD